jgi:hypothetical protein
MNQPKPEPAPAGVTLLDAARVLGVSEKTVRRRIQAGELEAEKIAIDGGGLAWRVYLPDDATDNATDNATAMTEARAGHAMDNAPDTPTLAPEPEMTVLDTQRPNATAMTGTRAGTAPDTSRLQEMREEIQFLRNAVEQHQRSEAELRTALRTALAAMPKALTEGAPQQVPAADASPSRTIKADGPNSGEIDKVTGQSESGPQIKRQTAPRRAQGFRKWLFNYLSK